MSTQDASPATVLVVDDMPDNVAILTHFLGKAGYRVLVARTGEEGVESAACAMPDLILLDVMMPVMDGFEVCKALKADPEIGDIPVIFISALSEAEDKIKAFEVGAADYIPKPFHFKEVLARVSTHVRLRRQHSQLQEQNRQLQRLKEQLIERSTELEAANHALRRLSNLDGLTQIANRRRFDEYYTQAWQQSLELRTPLALIITDIDYFKRYNDAYGHQAGDECLYQVAQAIQRAAKRPADLAARYGGEEFAVILPNTNAQGALEVAHKLHAEVEKLGIPHSHSQVAAHVSLSVGVACAFPHQGLSPASLIGEADKSLYEAKDQGRNQVNLRRIEAASSAD